MKMVKKSQEKRLNQDLLYAGAHTQTIQKLQQQIQEYQTLLGANMQRENKLMYFLYILKRKGFKIQEVFD